MNRLREIRKAARLTQLDIAEKLNTTAVTISRYENGKREPSLSRAKELADALNCTVDELLKKEEE